MSAEFRQTLFATCCLTGDVDLLSAVFYEEDPKEEWYRIFEYACECGHMPIVEYLVTKNVHRWGIGLEGGCRGGHLPIIERCISEGANNWKAGMKAAIEGDQPSVVELMMSYIRPAYDLNWGLFNAARANRVRMVELMLSKGANSWNTHFPPGHSQSALEAAYDNRNSEIMAILLIRGPAKKTQELKVLEDPRFWVNLLETTGVPRSAMAAITNIDHFVFSLADRIANDLRTGLKTIGWPTVLQPIVVEYCITL